jgi:hypothetical protein
VDAGLLHADESIAMFRMEPNVNRFMVDCQCIGMRSRMLVVAGLMSMIPWCYELADAACKNWDDLRKDRSLL